MDRGIYFDQDNRVRILDVDKFKASQALQDNCAKFVSNMQQLHDSVAKYVAAIDQQVERIEYEKLKAVGLRNRVAAMQEERRHKQQELQQQLNEKQEELDRLLIEEQSLQKVRTTQESTTAKLLDASSTGMF
ncbi:intraflagellar transport particle protein 20 [Scenedesmus sp. NREL 46B-D3]|nr:intraflagellar transport particle protein 20 [Scenedesmus sp. NREL 46B-D3]